jgi:DNA repair protein RecO (recombination protein O)
MKFQDSAIVLGGRKFSDHALLLTVLTHEYGLHKGLVQGAFSKKYQGHFLEGNLLSLQWQARLPEQLGYFVCEMEHSYTAQLLQNRARLNLLSIVCALLLQLIPERDPHPHLFTATRNLWEVLTSPLSDEACLAAYIAWELRLLREMGFGLHLSACAATGTSEELCFVSPKSGRAVSFDVGLPFAGKLLNLPKFMVGGLEVASAAARLQEQEEVAEALVDGLALTRYFLERWVCMPRNLTLPAARVGLLSPQPAMHSHVA